MTINYQKQDDESFGQWIDRIRHAKKIKSYAELARRCLDDEGNPMPRTELVKIISDGKPDPTDSQKKDEPRRAPKTVRRIARGLEVSEDVARTAAGLLPLASAPLFPGSVFVESDGSAYTNKDGKIVRIEDDAGNALVRQMRGADDALVRQMHEAVRKGEAAKAFLEAYYKTKPDVCAKRDDEGGATMKQ